MSDSSPEQSPSPVANPATPPGDHAAPTDATAPDEPVTKRYRLKIAYDGASYHGWQKQEPKDEPPLRTVAGMLEQHMQRVFKQPINLVGASRTDAGVHAMGQVAHFDAATRIPTDRLSLAINSRLPPDVEVVEAVEAAPDFHAIKGAVNKQYRYRMWNTHRRPLTLRKCVYHCWFDLDVDRMQDAAKRLVGEHDVAGFASINHGRATTVRTIYDCHIETDAPEVHVVVQGSGFLYNMVRIIAGTLVEVGRGHYEPERIDEILATTDRRLAGPTAPAHGLCLEWIKYAGD